MSGKYALIIGNTEYIDPGLAQLTAPGKDAEDFARVLKNKDICAFDDVSILLNQPEPVVRGVIDEFFDQKRPDDLLVLYFSGHGVRDELGALYLAVKNTIRSRLRSTAVKSDYIREAMDQSRSRRQVLILDCCNSGAFAQGTKSATGVSIGTASAFEGTGYGRVVLTASDATQFAWEGDKVIGETDNSLFTHFLIKGIEGEADKDLDGKITIDDLYDYAYEHIVIRTPKQTPGKWSYKQQGEIPLRQLTEAQKEKLRLLELERRKIAETEVALQSKRRETELVDNEIVVYEKFKQASRLINLISSTTKKLYNRIDWKSIRRISLVWGISWAIGWAIVGVAGWATEWGFVDGDGINYVIFGAIIGAISGFFIVISLEIKYILANWKNIFLITLGVTIAGIVGGQIGLEISQFVLRAGENWAIIVIIGACGLTISEGIISILVIVWQILDREIHVGSRQIKK
jgi:uncharacterized caspase-like protein